MIAVSSEQAVADQNTPVLCFVRAVPLRHRTRSSVLTNQIGTKHLNLNTRMPAILVPCTEYRVP